MPLSPRRVQKVPPQALYFDGVSNYVAVPYSDSLMPSDRITIEAVFQVFRTDRDMTILDKRYIEDWYKAYNLYFETLNQSISLQINGVFFRYRSNMVRYWYHYAATYSMYAGAVNIYLFGRKVAAYSYSNPIIPVTTPLWIGVVRNSGTKYWFNGYIAMIRIYSRDLSDDEIAWNYNYPDNPVRNGLVLWLHWDSINVNAGKWYDKSGFGNHGTIYGATLVQTAKPPKRVQSPLRVLAPVR